MLIDSRFAGRAVPKLAFTGFLLALASCSPSTDTAVSQVVSEPDDVAPSEATSFHVSHAPDFAPAGAEGGEFEPSFQMWVIENTTDQTRGWRVEVSEPWLDVMGPTQGDLEPGATAEVYVEVDDYIASLQGVGQHDAELRFLDRDDDSLVESDVITMSVTVALPQYNGWTSLRRHPNERGVFVSASGNDANDGLTPATAKRTIAAGKELIRDGHGDWLMLRRGDEFLESLGQWKTSGASIGRMQVVSAYGLHPDRPKLLTGVGPGVVTHGGGGSAPEINHVAIVGLHFEAHTHAGVGQPTGAALHQPSTNFLIEDCVFHNFNTGLVIQAINGRHTDVRLRRSIVTESYGVMDGNPQGLYAVNTDGLLIEECVFDTNGWNPAVAGATADIFSHNLYIDTDSSGVIVRGNIIANAASHGIQMRSGGMCVNNLIVRNSIGLMMAGNHGPQQEAARAILNVIIDGKDIDPANPRGWGIDFNNVVSGTIRRNLIVNNGDANLPISILLGGGGFGDGVHHVDLQHNTIYDWGGSMWFTGESDELTNISFRNNDVQNSINNEYLVDHFTLSNHDSVNSADNRFFNLAAPIDSWMHQPAMAQSVPEWKMDVGDTSSAMIEVPYVDPSRSVASYNLAVGGNLSYDEFMLEARRQSRNNWRREYTAKAVNSWIRAGFEE